VALHFAHTQKLQKKNQNHKDNGAGDGTPSGNRFVHDNTSQKSEIKKSKS